MAKPSHDHEEDEPLDPEVDRVRRKLVRFMVINMAILFVALMAVVGALVYKSGGRADRAAETLPDPADISVTGSIVLPEGAELVSQSVAGERLALSIRLADGTRQVVVYDLGEGRVVARIAIETMQP